jgi:hypothetical protein
MSDTDESEKPSYKPNRLPSEVLTQFVRSLTHQELIQLLTPIKARLLSEETVLHLNNFSADFTFTVREFLDFLGPSWQKWIHSSKSII